MDPSPESQDEGLDAQRDFRRHARRELGSEDVLEGGRREPRRWSPSVFLQVTIASVGSGKA